MTMGIKQVEQLVLLFGRTRLLQLLHRLQNQVQPQLKHNALVAELSDYRLVFLLPSYNRLDTLQLVYELDDQAERIAAQLYDTALALSFGICQPMVCDTLEDAIGYAEYCRTHNRDMERFSTSYAFYTPREKESLHHRFSLEQNILKAVYHHEFHLYLQPKYDSRTHTLIGAEALLRWIHNGMCIPLQEFLPIAMKTHVSGCWISTCLRLSVSNYPKEKNRDFPCFPSVSMSLVLPLRTACITWERFSTYSAAMTSLPVCSSWNCMRKFPLKEKNRYSSSCAG